MLKKIKKSLILRLIRLLSFNKPVRMIGYINDHITVSIGAFGVYEADILENIIKKTNNDKKNTVLDIGANIGNHSIFFARYYSRVISFEPSKITFDILCLNLKLNNIYNVFPYNFGLSTAEGQHILSHSEGNSGAARIINNEFDGDNREVIKTYRGDDILRKIGVREDIDLIKIDVEGHEVEVIQGLENLLSNYRPKIILEIENDKKNEISPESLRILKKFGYVNFYEIKESKNFIFKKLNIDNMKYRNYSAIFCEK